MAEKGKRVGVKAKGELEVGTWKGKGRYTRRRHQKELPFRRQNYILLVPFKKKRDTIW